jgi:ferrochelatase
VFDSVLLISFGGPQGRDDIRPFLANVLRGRRVSPERVEEVAHHYELFAGVSPITELTRRQAEGLRVRLAVAGRPLPVYVGMRNWHPLLADTLRTMHADGVRRTIGFIAAAHHSYSSCQQYRENVAAAQRELEAAGGHVDITFAGSWYDHPLFIDANAAHVNAARQRLPTAVRDAARLVFTAHSIPTPMAEVSLYREQLQSSARLIAEKARVSDWTVVYQSRSGRPQDPWLEPDVCDTFAARRIRPARGHSVVPSVLSAITSRCCDLDREARGSCVHRPADGARRSGERRSALPRHDDGCRAANDPPVRDRAGAPLAAAQKTRETGQLIRPRAIFVAIRPATVSTAGSRARSACPARRILHRRRIGSPG